MWTALLILALVWLALIAIAPVVVRNPRGDIEGGLAIVAVRVYVRVFHFLRVRGERFIPQSPTIDGKVIVVVANHTAGLDPLLVQAAMPRVFVRWMFAADMRGADWMQGLWDFSRVIMVQRGGATEVHGMREAMRTLSEKQAVGIFPEGKLERVRGRLEPFLQGVGLLIARGRAVVVPVVIRGTPHCRSSWASLFIPSASSVEFKEPIDFGAMGIKHDQIAPELERRFAKWMSEPLARE
jgi:1-acyl-sn-glycerol-3-phosphate acyltransferase